MPASTIELIVNLRTNLQRKGLDHGPATIARILLLVQDLQIRIINAATGELLRKLELDTTRDYEAPNSRKPPDL